MSSGSAGFPPGFEWDEAKNQANIRKHGVDFRDAVKIFQGPTLDRIDRRFDYGEERTFSLGDLDGQVVLAVIHTDRDGITRPISARQATSREREAYGEYRRELAGERSRKRGREIEFD